MRVADFRGPHRQHEKAHRHRCRLPKRSKLAAVASEVKAGATAKNGVVHVVVRDVRGVRQHVAEPVPNVDAQDNTVLLRLHVRIMRTVATNFS